MNTKQAIEHFGSIAALAGALRCTSAAVCQWGEFPPPKRQLQIAQLSDLKPESLVWDELLGKEGMEFAKREWCCKGAKKTKVARQ